MLYGTIHLNTSHVHLHGILPTIAANQLGGNATDL
jgi:hypothetical protein